MPRQATAMAVNSPPTGASSICALLQESLSGFFSLLPSEEVPAIDIFYDQVEADWRRIGLNFAGNGLLLEDNLGGALPSLRNKNPVAAILVSRLGVAFVTQLDREQKPFCDGLSTFFDRAVNFAAKTRGGADCEGEEN